MRAFKEERIFVDDSGEGLTLTEQLTLQGGKNWDLVQVLEITHNHSEKLNKKTGVNYRCLFRGAENIHHCQ